MAGKEPIGELDGTGAAPQVLIMIHKEGGKVAKRVGEIEGILGAT